MRRRESSIIVVLVLLLIVGGLVYLYSSHKREVSSDLAAVQQKSVALQQKSQDLGTTSKVKMALELNKNVSRYPLEVSTNAGVVTVNGKVASEADKVLIGRIAKDTPGVKDMINNVVVELTPEAMARAEKERATDFEIKSAVLESFLKNPDLKQDSTSINVEVSNKVVKLSGRVATPELKIKATTLARSVAGVQDVNDSGLQVTGPSPGYTTEVF